MGMYFESQPKLDTKICFFRAKYAMLCIGTCYCLAAIVMLFGPGYYTFAVLMGVVPFLCFCCSSIWTFILICVNSKCAYGCYAFVTLMMATSIFCYTGFYLIYRPQFYTEEFPKATSSYIVLFINLAFVVFLYTFCTFVYCRMSYFDQFNENPEGEEEPEDLYEVSIESNNSEPVSEASTPKVGQRRSQKNNNKSYRSEDTL